jgi:hypothetical protein
MKVTRKAILPMSKLAIGHDLEPVISNPHPHVHFNIILSVSQALFSKEFFPSKFYLHLLFSLSFLLIFHGLFNGAVRSSIV